MGGPALTAQPSSDAAAVAALEGLSLSPRESEVVELLLAGKSQKRIASELHLAPGSVNRMIWQVAARVPGRGSPVVRLSRWFWYACGGSTSALAPGPRPPGEEEFGLPGGASAQDSS